MGNFCCCIGIGGRRRRSNILPTKETTLPPPATELPFPVSKIVFAAAFTHPNNCYQSPPPPPYDRHLFPHYPTHSYQLPDPLIPGGRYLTTPPPYVQHRETVTIRNHVNLKKETLRLHPDPSNPNRVLVSFTFDATMSGRITVVFFAKEEAECYLRATKEDTFPPIIFDFEKGLGQKFIQPSGTGIDLTVFEDSELFKEVDTDVFPLAIMANSAPAVVSEEVKSGSLEITQVVYTKEQGEIKIQVVRQILWVNGLRYELQEIYGMENTVGGCNEGKECVVCLSEPRDTVVLPCRHWCVCSGCAEASRFHTNLCPVCRQPIERLLEIPFNGKDRR